MVICFMELCYGYLFGYYTFMNDLYLFLFHNNAGCVCASHGTVVLTPSGECMCPNQNLTK